ncbi:MULTISPECIES: alpha/beta fold hydrolase [Aquimarina]|uniref:alpha/beta fold hydrolase n=1 Tax=Aquimarina TaxID=290174 RepID=UPI0009448962|nr:MULTISPECIES: alpha/beta hydrolase [Aquimarina]
MVLPGNLSKWKSEGNYFTYKGNKIFYKDTKESEKDVVLLLHGYPTSSYDYHKIWEQLSYKYRLISPDFLGFGFSDKPRNYDYKIADQTEMINCLLTELEIKNIKMIAHNYGAIVGQEVLVHANMGILGFTVEKIIWLNSALFPELHKPTSIQKILVSPLSVLVLRLFNEKKFEKNFSILFGKNTKPTKEEIKELWILINYNNGKQIMGKLLHYISERKQYGKHWVDMLEKTIIPQKLINGIADPVSGLPVVKKYIERIRNAKVVELANIGHYPQIEAPDLVYCSIKEFFNKAQQ